MSKRGHRAGQSIRKLTFRRRVKAVISFVSAGFVIEKCWAWLKSRIRKLLRDSANLHDAIDSVLALAAS